MSGGVAVFDDWTGGYQSGDAVISTLSGQVNTH